MSVKSRAKNSSAEEIALLVDLVQENKPSLFGALSPSLTSEEKVNTWEDIAQKLTQAHGTVRTKDDVSKKWSNILAKHKPIISDKLSSIRKTGGGSPEGNLSEMELKIKSIKGKELFEGVASGIDLSLLSPISPLSESEMSIGSATDRDIKPRRKRKIFDDDIALTHSVKNVILQGEQEKLVVLKSIDAKLDRMVGLGCCPTNLAKYSLLCHLFKLLLPRYHLPLILTGIFNPFFLRTLIIFKLMINL